MNDDVRPAKRLGKSSLQASLDARNDQAPAPQPESFQTPDEVAAADDVSLPAQLVEQVTTELPADSTKKPASWRDKFHFDFKWPPGRREWIIIGVVITLIAGVTILFLSSHKQPVVQKTHKAVVKHVAPKPTTVASTLTGLQVDPSVNQRPVTAIMIENSQAARPQSGLSQAGVVFEAVAEGGVTRFVTIFQDTAPDNIGPVRSARPYYIDWMSGFDAAYAHVGGSPDALADIRTWGVKDLDQFANGGSYHRITSRDSPHNVYTSIATLNQLETSKGYTTSTYTGFPRKTDAPAKTPAAKSINLTMSGPVYNVHYDYNPAGNNYFRNEGGAQHIDANGNTPIIPKVVIAIVVPLGQGALDTSGAYYSNYSDIGSGVAYVFQDGAVTTGKWTKADRTSQITFTDNNNLPITLNPGQTWITAVSDTSKVSSSP
jgi:hypothetical protein